MGGVFLDGPGACGHSPCLGAGGQWPGPPCHCPGDFRVENALRIREGALHTHLFYLPFTGEDGWIQVDRTRMRRIGSLPEDVVPVGMLLEEGRLPPGSWN